MSTKLLTNYREKEEDTEIQREENASIKIYTNNGEKVRRQIGR